MVVCEVFIWEGQLSFLLLHSLEGSLSVRFRHIDFCFGLDWLAGGGLRNFLIYEGFVGEGVEWKFNRTFFPCGIDHCSSELQRF